MFTICTRVSKPAQWPVYEINPSALSPPKARRACTSPALFFGHLRCVVGQPTVLRSRFDFRSRFQRRRLGFISSKKVLGASCLVRGG